MPTTSRFSIGKDTLIRHVFEDNFFDRVPQLADLKDLFNTCRTTYKAELAKKGCTCRMTSEWARDCITPVLERVEAAKTTDHDLVRNFIRHLGRFGEGADVDHVGITVIYDRNYNIVVE